NERSFMKNLLVGFLGLVIGISLTFSIMVYQKEFWPASSVKVIPNPRFTTQIDVMRARIAPTEMIRLSQNLSPAGSIPLYTCTKSINGASDSMLPPGAKGQWSVLINAGLLVPSSSVELESNGTPSMLVYYDGKFRPVKLASSPLVLNEH
ncbi:MAG: hypothetical protein KGJ35_00775, partial [Patescibacteria group bacterium]|nr:hypothetical protein [Patescibacteria group bacterium]